MAFFKFRLPGQTTGETGGNFSNPPTESVEVLRRRARHRLIGASVLVVLGVVGFPLLFDTQPRPVSSDIAVDIPDRAQSKPLSTSKPSAHAVTAGLDPKEEIVPSGKDSKEDKSRAAADKSESAVASAKPAVEPKPEPAKAEAKSDSKVDAAKAEAAKSDAKDSPDAGPRFVVQVGAFSDDAKAREVRTKLEKAGLKTYTHVADTKEGKRTRVRVGPFTSRDEADKAAAKIKQLQLQPQILTL